MDGKLSDLVCAWKQKPVRAKLRNGFMWLPKDYDETLDFETGLASTYELKEAIKRFLTVPDDDRQMIVIE